MKQASAALHIETAEDAAELMRQEVRRGLSARPKKLSSKYFYDARGSDLFEQICDLPEYYLTRTELSILRSQGSDIANAIGSDAMVVEYGSGSGTKTGLLLEALETPVAYVPIEISESALNGSLQELGARFPEVEMLPMCGDFTRPLNLPRPARRKPARRLIFFPGSTIGNFEYSDAIRLLAVMRSQMDAKGLALVGIDLKKDAAVIEAAYNDSAGVTAAFTLNMLHHLNREAGTDFDVAQFEHCARYNPLPGRIETHIRSRSEQTISMGGSNIAQFAQGEKMHVEYSCKYAPEDFAGMAHKAGLKVLNSWSDPDRLFSLQLLGRIDR